YDAPPPLRSLRPDLPIAVEALVQQVLAKDPSARFRTAGALAQALAQAWPATNNAAAERPADIHEQPTGIWTARPEPAPPISAAPMATSEDVRPMAPQRAGTSAYGRAIGV